jgi:hypothetical protein
LSQQPPRQPSERSARFAALAAPRRRTPAACPFHVASATAAAAF